MLGSVAEIFEKERLGFAQLATRSALITKILYLFLWFYGSNNGLWWVNIWSPNRAVPKYLNLLFFSPGFGQWAAWVGTELGY